ncbi:family M23 zinc metallopeptidase with OapA domain protein [Shewanella hanedai]|uniref:Peptidoglycan DD-metalloendopeptidase family protein n=1 Tax=Shewanella hanedai TaxID=25 RepID=A0A553JJ83_SHEHA|nr:peptidoglycan DD-metalloendopeptidase family protein [Shewanella hanedai]TRY12519.1 peptidoglycan DD-metalloendopeptidase family protein [Shewanella hanedai]GGI95500.1 family M23 zinc metallopeptidase with OapA domain protein [Shewanella hanedai]
MGKVITLFKLLPKKHQILLTVLVCATLIILVLPADDAQASKNANSQLSGSIDLQHLDKSKPSQHEMINQDNLKVPLAFRTPTPPNYDKNKAAVEGEADTIKPVSSIAVLTAEKVGQDDTEKFTVKSGDTLAALFKRADLSARDVYEITLLPKAKKHLLKIMPGQEIMISKNSDGEFTKLKFHLDPVSTLVIGKEDGDYTENIINKQIESRTKFASATINSNFWNAGVTAGLTPNQIMQLATIFGWDIDFALDLRKDDNFSIIFEEEFADGEFLRNGNILAAEFINQGDRYTAVRYTDGNYYSEEGRSMRKAFLRSPVDFKYVSSSFNPKRLHPVTGQVRAHRGVDYVAAVGTPIKAAGKGRVIKSAYNQYNGNYVFIKHNDTYTTKYLHLKKRKVKQGESVKQGEIIGTLGATGRVTGAHLHYEFIVNGTHRNPRTVKLPKSLPIANKEKATFLALSEQIMSKLQQNKLVQLASQ